MPNGVSHLLCAPESSNPYQTENRMQFQASGDRDTCDNHWNDHLRMLYLNLKERDSTHIAPKFHASSDCGDGRSKNSVDVHCSSLVVVSRLRASQTVTMNLWCDNKAEEARKRRCCQPGFCCQSTPPLQIFNCSLQALKLRIVRSHLNLVDRFYSLAMTKR